VHSKIEIRDLASDADYAACIDLQRETWGAHFSDVVPANLLRIARKIGGVAAGAFEQDRLVGFVFGLTGVMAGETVHWSDLLAVRATERGRGIGELLKRYQRDTLLARGIERVCWSFDPLDAKNAHINFNRLGVFAREYVVDMYGHTNSPLHTGIGTDRLIAVWELDSERVRSRLAGRMPMDVGTRAQIQVEIPRDIHALNRADPGRAREWRERTRQLFLKYLPDYVVSDFSNAGANACYGLTSAATFAA
jgi:predicted GNAT superfamily acetyltransferase